MNKPMMSLLAKMLPALEEVARLSEFGNNIKYEPDSWLYHNSDEEALSFAKKRLDSLMRHAFVAAGDLLSKDEESSQHELAAVAWNALAILTVLYQYGHVSKDRPGVLDLADCGCKDSILDTSHPFSGNCSPSVHSEFFQDDDLKLWSSLDKNTDL